MIKNSDGLELKEILRTIGTARTPLGGRLKMVALYLAFIFSLLVPMGVLLIYWLWKHGAKIQEERRLSGLKDWIV
ncbi:MAG: hypothetical protein ACP5D5_08650 [Acidithiobacillus sp.]|uniref:hypothetical protein n=1 Tax=Acidithiobacillus sp. TaxID=1872118 RepID=UPI0025B8C606|nr:hypothetical protein [Acidithiobacillus sp.]